MGELRDPLHHQQEWREAEERHQAELQATVDRHEAALAELANRIVGLVEAGRRPWWRRLIGRGLRDVL